MKRGNITRTQFHEILNKASQPIWTLQLLKKVRETEREVIALEEELDKAKAIVIVCKRLYEFETGGDANCCH